MGWFKFWSEEIIQSSKWPDPVIFNLWCRLMAFGGRDNQYGKVQDLQVGGSISIEALARLCGGTTERVLELLEMWAQKKDIKISPICVTILNWNHFQSEYQRQKGYKQGYKGSCNLKCLFGVEDPSYSILSVIVLDFFKELGSTEEEGKFFHDHFESNGWKISGRTPMRDWKAAARNWVRRSREFKAGKQPKDSNRFTPAGGIKGEPGKYDKLEREAEERGRE